MLGGRETDVAYFNEVSDNNLDHETDDDGSDDGDSISLSSDTKRSTNVKEHVFDEKKARRAVAMFICAAEVPPQSVEEFVHLLNPQFEIDFDTIESECMEVYKEEKEKIKVTLKNLDGQISLSVDMLSYEYVCLTAHFIDDKWKLKKLILSFRRIWCPNEDSLEEAILKSLSDWDIESKISTLTLANNEDNDETFQIVKDRIQEKKQLQLNGQVFRVNCCADIFSLMAEDAFDEIRNTIDKVRLIVFWGKSLPLWNITLDRLKEALEFESKGEYSKKDDYDGFDIPSPKEWKKVKGVCKLVESIYKVANVLFETKHLTANIFLHLLRELQASLTRESISSDRFIRRLAKKILKKFDKYWKDMFLVLAIATVLDPQFKMKYIEFSSSKYESSDDNSQVKMVLEAIRSLYEDYVSRILEREDSVSDSTSSDPEEDSPRHIEGSHTSYDDFNLFQEYCQLIQSTSQPPKSELDWYLEEPVLAWSQDFNALRWWKDASSKYPSLSRMARDFLAIPISLTTSFEAYYTQQREANKHIVSLGPDLMNALTCTRSWFQEY